MATSANVPTTLISESTALASLALPKSKPFMKPFHPFTSIFRYSIINCPAATIVSADKCRLVADYSIEYPSIESDGVMESPENFAWNFYTRFSGGDRNAFTFADSKADKVLQLQQGRTVIVLEGTKNQGAEEVRCTWSVDVSVASCDWNKINIRKSELNNVIIFIRLSF